MLYFIVEIEKKKQKLEMRTLQNPFKERKERKSRPKHSAKVNLMKKLRMELKRAIEHENINMVRELLSPPSDTKVDTTNKGGFNQAKSNLIETNYHSMTALKRRASSEISINCETRRVIK